MQPILELKTGPRFYDLTEVSLVNVMTFYAIICVNYVKKLDTNGPVWMQQ